MKVKKVIRSIGSIGPNPVGTTSCAKETMPKYQVIHDEKQLKSPSELKVGKSYDEMNVKFGLIGVLEIIDIDESKGQFTIVNHYANNKKSIEHCVSMADRGLMPYDSGLWNPENYLLPLNR